MEARAPTTTNFPKYEISVRNQIDRASLGRIQKEADPEEQDYELNEAVKLEGNGVPYSKPNTEGSSMVGSQDVLDP